MSISLDQIVQGDAVEVMRSFPADCIDLIVADPPYGVDKAVWDSLSLEWLRESHRVLKRTGSIYVFGSVWWYPIVHVEMLKHGFKPRNIIAWFYENGMARQTRNYVMQYDPVGFFTKSDEYTFNLDDVRVPYKSERVKSPIYKKGRVWTPNPLGKKIGNVIDIPALAGANYAAERTEHPTQKPEALIRVFVRASSNRSDVVLDPFVGSGTTAVVSRQLDRHYVGIEINESYCQIARRRLSTPILATSILADKHHP